MPNAAQGENYSFMPCRMVHLQHFEALELWELWNLFEEWSSKATLNALNKAYLACVVVSKAFRLVGSGGVVNTLARQQTPWDNACQVFYHFEKVQENLRVCPSIDICHLSLSQLYLTRNLSWCSMMEENFKTKRKKPKRPLYDDKECMEFFEMVKGGKAYLKVQHDKRFTTGLMLGLQRTIVNQPSSVGQA